MGFNGSGTFVRLHSWIDDRNNGIKITADRHDAEDDGFAAGLSNTITKDGQSTTSAKIPFAAGVSISDGNVGAPGLSFISDTNTGIWRSGADTIGFAAGGTNMLSVSSSSVSVPGATATTSPTTGAFLVSGGVGIAGALSVGGGVVTRGASLGASGTDYPSVGHNIGYTGSNGVYNYLTSDFAAALNFFQGGFQFNTAPSGTAGNAASYTARVTIANNGNTAFLSTTASTNHTTGAVTIAGGLGVAGKVNIAGFLGVNGASAASYPALIGTSAGGAFRVLANGSDGTAIAATDSTGSLSFKALEISGSSISLAVGVVSVTNSTASTNASTGALVVTGGLGVGGALNVGSVIKSGGASLIIENAAWPELFLTKNIVGYWSIKPGLSATNSLDITVNGGSVAEFTTSQELKLKGTTASTSTTTGTLIVPGGAGVAGNVYIGGNLDVAGTVSFGGATLVTTTGVQTLTNKTLDNPAIGSGAVLGGTFSGSPTFSGAVTFASTAQITSNSTTAFRAGASTPVFTVDGTNGGGSGTFTVKRGDGSNQANTDVVVKANGNLYIDVGSANDIRLGQTISTGTIQMKVTTTPFSSGAADLGSSSVRWGTVFSTNADNISSDERDKVVQGHYLGLDFIRDVSPLSFVRKDDPKGRLHFGVSAQQLQAALRRKAVPDGAIVSSGADEKLGVAYDELIAPLIAAAQELDSRLSRVESHLVL